MELVVNIDDETYNDIKKGKIYSSFRDVPLEAVNAIANGTPLPKGHGDLIDVNRKITVPIYDEQFEEWGEKILTVREALNRWSNEGITVKDVVISADKAESEEV